MAGKEVTVWIAYITRVDHLTHREELRLESIEAIETEKQLILKRRHPVTFGVRAKAGSFPRSRAEALTQMRANLENRREALTAQMAQTITHLAMCNVEIVNAGVEAAAPKPPEQESVDAE